MQSNPHTQRHKYTKKNTDTGSIEGKKGQEDVTPCRTWPASVSSLPGSGHLSARRCRLVLAGPWPPPASSLLVLTIVGLLPVGPGHCRLPLCRAWPPSASSLYLLPGCLSRLSTSPPLFSIRPFCFFCRANQMLIIPPLHY